MFSEIARFFTRLVRARDLRRKIIITAIILIFFRLIAHIPAAGIDRGALKSLVLGSPLLSLLDIFSGGTFANFSIAALGLNPYINASVILQLLTFVSPSLEELSKEGEYGQEKINQYTRFLTVPIAFLQGIGMFFLLRGRGVIANLDPVALVAFILTMVAGTMLSVWLGELITQYGFSNGISFLIFAGIVSRIPVFFGQTATIIQSQDVLKFVFFLFLAIPVIAAVVFMNEATRQVPINYARKSARSVAVGVPTYLPIRLNQAGVIPIIFAISLILIPSLLSQFLGNIGNPIIARIAQDVSYFMKPSSPLYNLIYFLLVVGFTYFYTAVIFNPEKIAENLQKSGGFISGVRPGKETQNYLSFVLSRVTFAGAIFLAFIAVLPSLFQNLIGISNLTIGGTGLLIVVSVVLETTRELESQLVMKNYDSFL